MTAPASVQIWLLGRFAVRRDGVEIPAAAFGGRLARRVVRYLATEPGTPRPRETLAEVLWPTHPPTDPVANLSVQISRARRVLGDGIIETVGPGYALTREPWCRIDGEEFRRGLDRARAESDPHRALARLREVLALWRGGPLPEDLGQPWADAWREQLLRTHLHALEAASRAAIACRATDEAVEYAHRAVAAEPLREAGYLVLGRALAAAGDVAGALATHTRLRERLADQLGLDPSPVADAAFVELLRGDDPTPGPAAGPPTGSQRTSGRTPTHPWPFVGRDAELAAVHDGLMSDGLVLVAGGPGSGKTALLDQVVAGATGPVARARASLPERQEPFALAGALLREVAGHDVAVLRDLPARTAAVLCDLVPELIDDAAPEVGPTSASTRRALTLQAATLVLLAAGRHETTVVVDDLQWSDDSSLQLLRRVAARADRPRLLFTLRSEDLHLPVLQPLLAEARRAAARTVHLGALEEAAVLEVLADQRLATVVVEETDRSPFAFREFVRCLERDGLISPIAPGRWGSARPDAVAAARRFAREGRRGIVVRRVAALPDEAGDVLAVLSLLGRDAGPQVLAATLERDEARVLDELEVLTTAELVRFTGSGWRTAHDDLAAAIVDLLSDARRSRLHAAIAHALVDDLGERARHLAAAGHDEAPNALAVAARHRLDHHAAVEAGELAEAGLRIAPSGSATAIELHRVRGETRFRANDPDGARADLRTALAASDDPPPAPGSGVGWRC
jgi:DNA-binding SARP family transcriptional activator